LFKGYIFQEGNTARFEPLLENEFLTYDLGIVSGNCLKLLGRMDSFVKVLGILVDIESVERRFLEIAAGRVTPEKFAVIALPDQRKEHVLVAVFEGEIPNDCVDQYQRVALGIEQLEQSLSFPSFPRSSIGKLRRGELVKMCEILLND
jgi:acyl-CoA synthetase (AMP-forming)/AMP-acid ligase II